MLDSVTLREVDARLENACDHVSEFWFPVNSALLKRVRTGFTEKRFEGDLSLLLNEIRGDFALYAYCIKELLTLLRREGVQPPSDLTPGMLLEWAGLPRLTKILNDESRTLSKHHLSYTNPAQAGRFREAITSVATAELLAEQNGINGDLGFSAALLRQLSYLLIAWNYPRVYENALVRVKSGADLDQVLQEILGFPPKALGRKLAQRWGLADQFCEILTELDNEKDGNSTSRSDAAKAYEFCELSEALARANSPDCYPKTAASDWEFAQAQLQALLGPEGLSAISERITQLGKTFRELAPSSLRSEINLNPRENLQQFQRQRIESLNPHALACNDPLRDRLTAFYDHDWEKLEVKARLRTILKEILPLAGFSGGCIFTVDAFTSTLTPRTRFGSPQSEVVRDLGYTPYKPDSDMINATFQTQDPVTVKQKSVDGKELFCIAEALGRQEWVGVLYMELPADQLDGREEQLKTHFQAVAKAIVSCLHVPDAAHH